jgi:glucosyl-dolichyl phosphate glucuronosyltransferase
MNSISVILCTWNPNKELLNRVIQSLKNQTLFQQNWELIIIDNKSDVEICSWLDLSWHSDSRILREEKQGLIHARIKGSIEAQYELLVSVDDDTLLADDYLENIQNIYTKYPNLGTIGGRSIPIFEFVPPLWIKEFYGILAIRDLGEFEIIEQLENEKNLSSYPTCGPLLIAPRKSCMLKYIDFFNKNFYSKDLGRKGNDLSSGEDNDINLFIYKTGFQVGYFPELIFYHIIPESRTKVSYLAKLVFSSSISWVKVLENYNINPWRKIPKWTVPFRNLRAWISHKAWKNEVNYIKWKGACGTFQGLSEI